MTIEELSQLSDDERDLKVAEKLGATWEEIGADTALVLGEDILAVREPNESIIYVNMPCYSTSLDAIHEAEKTLKTDKQKDEFSDHLMHIMDDVFPLWNATARQRAIAFLLV